MTDIINQDINTVNQDNDTVNQDNIIIKHDLGDGLSFYEEDGICYIDVDKDDEVIDEIQAKIIKASEIREYIKNEEFEKIKPYVPEDAFNVLYNEYRRYKGYTKFTQIYKKEYDAANKIKNLGFAAHGLVKRIIGKKNLFKQYGRTLEEKSRECIKIANQIVSLIEIDNKTDDNKKQLQDVINQSENMIEIVNNIMNQINKSLN